jgi:ABC-type branched-subunit amino acid transport system substrate-binding protein
MKRLVHILALLLALALSAAACTSDPDEAADDGGGTDDATGTGEAGDTGDGTDGGSDDGATDGAAPPDGPTTGITDDTIRIGFIGADFSALEETGLVPVLGDQPKIVQAVVDEINADGGVAGREIEVRIELVDGLAGPEIARRACLEMTQDFEAFAVILAPAVGRDTARCSAVTNETLTLNSTGFDLGLYEEADGRLFSTGSATSMSTDRQYQGWAELLDDDGVLDGKTIGIVTAEQAAEFPAAVESALVPTLEALGHEVAVNVNLPCPEGDRDCEQHEAAIQQMKRAGVDLVFMAAPNLIGPTVVQAAINLDFHPQWVANGNQVTDTVSQFFESVKDEWDGTIGTSTVFAQNDDITDEARACNEAITRRSGEEYEPGSDAFGFAAVNCLTMQVLQLAGEEIEPADLNQATMIQAIEGLGEITLNAGPPGSLSPDKHDAGDYLFMADYSAAESEFVDRPGEPVKIDG